MLQKGRTSKRAREALSGTWEWQKYARHHGLGPELILRQECLSVFGCRQQNFPQVSKSGSWEIVVAVETTHSRRGCMSSTEHSCSSSWFLFCFKLSTANTRAVGLLAGSWMNSPMQLASPCWSHSDRKEVVASGWCVHFTAELRLRKLCSAVLCFIYTL